MAAFYLKRCKGLTLIEVLIALAIVAIAMTAVIKATSQNIRDTTYVQERLMATWVGLQAVNEARAGLLVLPEYPDTYDQEVVMLGRPWKWAGYYKSTPNQHMQEVGVEVSVANSDVVLARMTGYVYKK